MGTALKDAKVITNSLKRSNASMNNGVIQAESAVELLQQDGNVIKNTLDAHKYELKGALTNSKRSLQKLQNMQWLEKWIYRLSLAFFIMVVIFIIGRRTFGFAFKSKNVPQAPYLTENNTCQSSIPIQTKISDEQFDHIIKDISPKNDVEIIDLVANDKLIEKHQNKLKNYEFCLNKYQLYQNSESAEFCMI